MFQEEKICKSGDLYLLNDLKRVSTSDGDAAKMPEKVEIEEEEEDDLYDIFDAGDLIDDGDPSTKLEGEKIPKLLVT